MRRKLLAVLTVLLVVLAGCASDGGGNAIGTNGVDSSTNGQRYQSAATSGSGNVGVSVGGAQDANVFRRNVDEGYVPQPTDIVPEGVYHDYYFDTNLSAPCDARFCAAYDRAITEDPLSGEREQYLAVGLNSGITQEQLQRQKLNLIVVLDVSGSMHKPFDRYAYDGAGNATAGGKHNATAATGHNATSTGESVAKIDAAGAAVGSLTRRLEADDRLALVTYESGARVRQPMTRVGDLDPAALRDRVAGFEASGSTNLAAGMAEAEAIADEYPGEGDNRTTRIVYVTDAMPNVGDTSTGGLGERIETQAERGVHTTFVGVGVDFNSRLTNALADVRGANYYSVHSPSAFEQRMADGFEYMVTPIAHDLSLSVDGEGYEIENVYGVPGSADGNATGEGRELLDVATLFPSRSENGSGEGSVMLVELERNGDESDGEVMVTASYETPRGEERERTKTVTFADREAPYYESTGVRKAVALTRYATLMQNWAAHERAMANGEEMDVAAGVERREDLGKWEQTSVELGVTEPYDQRIATFRTYFEGEMDALNASRMEQDLDVLAKLDGLENGEE